MSKRARILLAVRELTAGGSERQLTEIAKHLDRNRFDVRVAYFRPGMRLNELEKAGIPCVPLHILSFRQSNIFVRASEFVRYLRLEQIDLLHTFDYPLTCFAVPLARYAKVPVVLSSQRGHRSLIPKPYLGIVRMTDLSVDGIVVNCRFLQEHLTRDEDVPRSKVRICYNGLDLDPFEAASGPADRNAEPNASVVLGCISMLRPEKNLQLLLRAAAELIHSGERVEVLLVGSGREGEHLRQLADSLEIKNRVTFIEAQRDITSWLRKIDIFVLPSTSEALSNSLMEAMAAARAVVASDVGGNPELVTHQSNGLLFRPESLSSLVEQIRALVHSEQLRKKYASAAAVLIRNQFSAARAAQNMAAIYEGYLNRQVRG